MQLFQYEQQVLCTFLISHVSREVLYHIQLDVTFPDIDQNKDTCDLWVLLKKSAVRKGTYNLQDLRNEWANFKQYTLDDDSHVVSLTPSSWKSKQISRISGFLKQYSIETYGDWKLLFLLVLTPCDIKLPSLILVFNLITPPTMTSRHNFCI